MQYRDSLGNSFIRMLVLMTMVAAVMTLAASERPVVKIKQGAISGTREEGDYFSFLTIPFAKPPVGPLRLKDPEPAIGWTGVRNGSLPFPRCPQANFFGTNVPVYEGQEDCLYLNVYTPKPYEANLPVMVYIHGGALYSGFAMGPVPPMIPASLMRNDVVLVSMNHRLGALGFLSTGDSVLPGNLGFKDQTLALKWVQENIKEFGGDPKQVTIFGVSSGGLSCHMHVLSPASKGLFQRAILQSGTALLNIMFAPAREGAIAISNKLGCTGDESQQLLDCFMKASPEELVDAQTALSEWYSGPLTVGAQVDGTYLPDTPAALLKSGRYNEVDMMVGWLKDDGNIFTAGLFSNYSGPLLEWLKVNFHRAGPIILSLLEEENHIYMAGRGFYNYMDDIDITPEDEPAFTELMTDAAYKMPGIQSAEFNAKSRKTKTYMYCIEHYLEKALYNIIRGTYIERDMAGHGDDNVILFTRLSRPQDLFIQNIIGTLWANFAKTGNPTANGDLGFKWNPVSRKGPLEYLAIKNSPTMKTVKDTKREFWNSLPTKGNKILYPEYFGEKNNGQDAAYCSAILSDLSTCVKEEFLG